MQRNKAIFFLIVLLTCLCVTVLAESAEFRLQGQRLWYSGSESFEQFMRHFDEMGVAVYFDPAIEMTITADVEGLPLERALDRLLSPLNYVATWSLLRGPVEDLVSLKEIRVFREGHPGAALPYAEGERRRIASFMGRRFVDGEILIGFRAGTKRSEVELILERIDANIVDCLEALGVYRIRFAPGADIPSLADHLRRSELVASSEPNYVTSLPDYQSPSGEFLEVKYNDTKGSAGRPAQLAVLDSGLDSSIFPSDLLGSGFDSLNPGSTISDQAGHGTHMAMIASSYISPKGLELPEGSTAQPVMAVKTFDGEGNTSNYDLMRAMDYSLKSGAKVINLSWGSENHSDFIAAAVSYAQQEGAIVVAAAGNEASGQAVYPAAYDGVLAISASNPDGSSWDQSNYGEFVFAAAPGTASLPKDSSGTLGSYAGTSIASAAVSGAIARYYSENPAASPQDVIDRLRESLSAHSSDANGRGYGMLDAAALQRFMDK
jgi:thermitase